MDLKRKLCSRLNLQVVDISVDDEQVEQLDNNPSATVQQLETNNFAMILPVPFVLPASIDNPMENLTVGKLNQSSIIGTNHVCPNPMVPAPGAVTVSDLNLNLNLMMDPSPLPLKLSLQRGQRESSSSRHSAFQVMPTLNHGDGNNMISVA